MKILNDTDAQLNLRHPSGIRIFCQPHCHVLVDDALNPFVSAFNKALKFNIVATDETTDLPLTQTFSEVVGLSGAEADKEQKAAEKAAPKVKRPRKKVAKKVVPVKVSENPETEPKAEADKPEAAPEQEKAATEAGAPTDEVTEQKSQEGTDRADGDQNNEGDLVDNSGAASSEDGEAEDGETPITEESTAPAKAKQSRRARARRNRQQCLICNLYNYVKVFIMSRAKRFVENASKAISVDSKITDNKIDAEEKSAVDTTLESTLVTKADKALTMIDEREVRIHSDAINGGIGVIRCMGQIPYELAQTNDGMKSNAKSSATLGMFSSYENGPIYLNEEPLPMIKVRKLEAAIEQDLRGVLTKFDKMVEAVMKSHGFKLAK